jgi:hypothetical protein
MIISPVAAVFAYGSLRVFVIDPFRKRHRRI